MRRPSGWTKYTVVHSSIVSKPWLTSAEFTAWMFVTRLTTSALASATTCQVNPKPSFSCRTEADGSELMRATLSDSADWNAAPSTCRKATAPTPVGVKPVAACRVSAAGGRAKRSSRLARFGLVRPSSASKKPMELLVGVVRSGWCGDRAGRRTRSRALMRRNRLSARSFGARELGGDLRQLIETLLQRGVGREELADGGLAADGRDERQMV